MRRVLVTCALAALPLLASAQIVTANPGELRGKVNNLIGSAQCKGEAPLDVAWQMLPRTSGNTVGGVGTVRIFASDLKRDGTTGDPRTCYIQGDNPAGGTVPIKVQVAQFDEVQLLQNDRTITGAQVAAMMAAFNVNCDTETTSKPIYMCALAYPTSTASITSHFGYANGDFTLNTQKPGKPTINKVESADRALRVSFSESSEGANATEFRVVATTTDTVKDPVGTHSARANASPVMVGGLVNNVKYTVTVIAISEAGTESEPSDGKTGTPLPTADFWEWYRDERGGTEQGGCATGAAGAVAMLGAAALLRVRRRKP